MGEFQGLPGWALWMHLESPSACCLERKSGAQVSWLQQPLLVCAIGQAQKGCKEALLPVGGRREDAPEPFVAALAAGDVVSGAV